LPQQSNVTTVVQSDLHGHCNSLVIVVLRSVEKWRLGAIVDPESLHLVHPG